MQENNSSSTTNNSKDSAIKLFGQSIPFKSDSEPPTTTISSADELPPPEIVDEAETEKPEKDSPSDDVKETSEDDTEDSADQETNDENPKTPSISEEFAKSKTSETEKEQNDPANTSQEKTLKKPDKILPCPRCNSMDTKFCYFNNYNINQPRHFCKACQRYWTAGGTMRNVPVGAGRRKNKNSACHYRHITISEALQAARVDAPNGTHNPALKTNGKVLSFGLDAPICDSMASMLNLADKKVFNGATRNGIHNFEEQKKILGSCKGRENSDDCSSVSSVTVSNSVEGGGVKICQQEPIMHNVHGFAPPIPCLPGVPWPYPWNSALPPPVFCPPGYPMPFYPPFGNYGWNIPLMSPQSSSSASNQNGQSGPNSPTLGKHSREGDMLKRDDMEKEESPKHKNGCVVVPKTLRIDDPTEAAKSSIWATLGIKNESYSSGGLFKSFQSKTDEKNHVNETSSVLRANPAALSRSMNFHESS